MRLDDCIDSDESRSDTDGPVVQKRAYIRTTNVEVLMKNKQILAVLCNLYANPSNIKKRLSSTSACKKKFHSRGLLLFYTEISHYSGSYYAGVVGTGLSRDGQGFKALRTHGGLAVYHTESWGMFPLGPPCHLALAARSNKKGLIKRPDCIKQRDLFTLKVN